MPKEASNPWSDVALRQDFREANPAPFGRTEGNPDSVRRLGVIETRAAGLKERMRDHIAQHETNWVAREAVRLWSKQAVPKLIHPAPRGVSPEDFWEQVFRQARRNVRARATRRLTALNAIKTRMQNAVIRTAPQQQAPPELALKPQFHKALNRTAP